VIHSIERLVLSARRVAGAWRRRLYSSRVYGIDRLRAAMIISVRGAAWYSRRTEFITEVYMERRAHEIESKKLLNLPVVAIGEGKVLGRVHDLVFDPRAQSLLGVQISGKHGRDGAFVDCGRIRRLGPFAVTVMEESDLQRIDDHARAHDILTSGVRVRGAQVMTDAGEPAGRIDRVWMAPDGMVLRYRSSDGGFAFARGHEITPADVQVIGEDAIIIAAEAIHGGMPEPEATAASEAQAFGDIQR
jgi:uncharacterized protein YrrD